MMPPPDLEVVEVVRRRDLHRAGALLGIGIVVRHDRDAPADQRQDRVPADQMAVALVVGMHRDRGVAQHRLGPRRRDRDVLVRAFDRVLDVPERALDLDLLHFEVGDRGLEFRVPIDEALVLVDQVLLVEIDEDLDDGLRQALVHGEALARPVAGGAQALELVDDRAAGLGLPRPDLLEEFLAPDLAAARLLPLHHLPLDHHLGRDTGVIGAGLPQHVAAAHALEAAEDVLQRVVERVPHVQRAGHVRRRDHDGVGLRIAPLRTPGAERLARFPHLADAALDFGGLIGLFDRHAG